DEPIVRDYCKVLSILLLYPDERWREELPMLTDTIAEWPESRVTDVLSEFIDLVEAEDAWRFRDRYVQTFDFGKKSNLYMTYDEHGEERERGRALIELKKLYADEGFDIMG